MTMYDYKIEGTRFHGTIIVDDSANANHIAEAINDALDEKAATVNNVTLSCPMRLNAIARYDAGVFGEYEGASWID